MRRWARRTSTLRASRKPRNSSAGISLVMEKHRRLFKAKWGKGSLSRIARILVVLWPLIWAANTFADDCRKFSESRHGTTERSVVSGHDDGREVHAGAHEHGKNVSNDKESGSCCCVKITAASAAGVRDISPPFESQGKLQPGPVLQDGLSPPLPVLRPTFSDSWAPPRSHTPLFLLHLRLLN